MHTTGFRRLTTGEAVPFDPAAYVRSEDAPGDPPILDVTYDYEATAAELRSPDSPWRFRRDVFRYTPVLPVESPAVVLPAGGTPLVSAPRLAERLGMRAVFLKDETRNPTRCLKDRASAVAITMALAAGHTDVYCASAGNAAISLAGFAAQAGLTCHAYVPNIASRTRLAWLERFGAHVHVSSGNYDQAYDEAEQAGAENGWYSRNCALNPFLVEGKKTCSFEIADELGGDVPDYVIVPSGDGCTTGAIGKGFREYREMGFIDRLPHLVGVQSEAIQPLVRRYHEQPAGDDSGSTDAASISVRQPRNAVRLLNEVRESDGDMIAVPDGEIQNAQHLLATEAGVVAEFTSAATLAALFRLAEGQSLAGKSAVLVITGGRLDDE